jgi:hypothetical protein
LHRLREPAPTTSNGVRLGQGLSVEWAVAGRAERIARLLITLEGRERATFSRGTDTITEHQVFARLPR